MEIDASLQMSYCNLYFKNGFVNHFRKYITLSSKKIVIYKILKFILNKFNEEEKLKRENLVMWNRYFISNFNVWRTYLFSFSFIGSLRQIKDLRGEYVLLDWRGCFEINEKTVSVLDTNKGKKR